MNPTEKEVMKATTHIIIWMGDNWDGDTLENTEKCTSLKEAKNYIVNNLLMNSDVETDSIEVYTVKKISKMELTINLK